MRVPLSWLREYVDVELTPEALAARLTMLGMEVKSIVAWGEITGACVGLGYVRSDVPITGDWIRAGRYEVNVGGQCYPISLSLKPIYDPGNERTKS